MIANAEYTWQEAEAIVLLAHAQKMPAPRGFKWLASRRSYGDEFKFELQSFAEDTDPSTEGTEGA